MNPTHNENTNTKLVKPKKIRNRNKVLNFIDIWERSDNINDWVG